MILTRAPLRISFVGGGTDLREFYRRSPGRVISATLDKYVFLVLNPTPMINKISARYSITETVDHPSHLQHTRIKAALLDLGIKSNLEIGSFASLPAKTGLGSSSSFSVALMKGLYAYLGKNPSSKEVAEAACHLEIDLVGEPIGKQDQYAAAFGGFNIFQFNPDESVDVLPIFLDYQKKALLEKHSLLFFSGVTRPASNVLSDQKTKIEQNFETYKKMADSVFDFQNKLLAGDVKGMAEMLHEGWLRKKSLSSKISSSLIDNLYEAGIEAGAWGGKVLGAGGGGCLFFLAPPEKHKEIIEALQEIAKRKNLSEAKIIPFKFVQSGVDILYNDYGGIY